MYVCTVRTCVCALLFCGYISLRVCAHAFLCVCVCVCLCVCVGRWVGVGGWVVPVDAEAKGVGQKGDRSAANRSGIWKVENYGFCLVSSLVML